MEGTHRLGDPQRSLTKEMTATIQSTSKRTPSRDLRMTKKQTMGRFILPDKMDSHLNRQMSMILLSEHFFVSSPPRTNPRVGGLITRIRLVTHPAQTATDDARSIKR
jgi:hypothetical protein